MNHLESCLSSVRCPVAQNHRGLIGWAWGITLLVSALPDLVWVKLAGSTPVGLTLAKMGLLLGLGVTVCRWKSLGPLRNYCGETRRVVDRIVQAYEEVRGKALTQYTMRNGWSVRRSVGSKDGADRTDRTVLIL